MTIERCEISRCRTEVALTYLDHGVCERHWNQLTAEDAPPDALRIALGIEALAPTAMEDRTMDPTNSKTTKMEAAAPSAARGKTTKPAKRLKPTPKAKATKPQKQKAPKEPKPDFCVFAFRLPITDRDLIHKAADAKKLSATKFVVDTILEASRSVLKRT